MVFVVFYLKQPIGELRGSNPLSPIQLNLQWKGGVRFMNLNRNQLDNILKERLSVIGEDLQVQLDRRLQGTVAPNDEIVLNLYAFRKDREKLALAVISWWLGSSGIYIRGVLKSRPNDYLTRAACRSKSIALEILQSHFHERDFFGNFLPLIQTVGKNLRWIQKGQRRARRAIRRRGYSDHGSQRPRDQWLPSSDWSFTAEMFEIERLRQKAEHTYLFTVGLLEG
jgi:hypothetical protein